MRRLENLQRVTRPSMPDALPPIRRIRWSHAYRIVSSRFPPVGVYDRIADPAVHELCDLVCGSIARRFEDVANTRAAFARTARSKPASRR